MHFAMKIRVSHLKMLFILYILNPHRKFSTIAIYYEPNKNNFKFIIKKNQISPIFKNIIEKLSAKVWRWPVSILLHLFFINRCELTLLVSSNRMERLLTRSSIFYAKFRFQKASFQFYIVSHAIVKRIPPWVCYTEKISESSKGNKGKLQIYHPLSQIVH